MSLRQRRGPGLAVALPALALVLAALVAGCGSDNGGDSTDAEPPQFTDLSEPIEVGAGQTFEIVLDANPTTGYSWRVTISSAADAITLEGRNYEADPGSEDLAGGGGTETFTFEAAKAGEAEITFGYLPPGEPAKPAETRTADVTVR